MSSAGGQERNAASRGGASYERRLPRLDAANISGLTQIMNTQVMRPGVDYKKEEQAIQGRSVPVRERAQQQDPVEMFTAEIDKLMADLGIEPAPAAPAAASAAAADSFRVAEPAAAARPLPPPAYRPPKAQMSGSRLKDLLQQIEDQDEGADRYAAAGHAPAGRALADAADDDDEFGDEGDEFEDGEEEEEYTGDDEESQHSRQSGRSGGFGRSGGRHGHSHGGGRGGHSHGHGHHGHSHHGGRHGGRHGGSGLSPLDHFAHREPQARLAPGTEHAHISSVLASLRGAAPDTPLGVEKEHELDEKSSKLEQIAAYRITLDEEGVDCSALRALTAENTMAEIDSMLNLMRLKIERIRFSGIAEEAILFGAHAVESVFDGTRRVPVLGWRPDYTGYHNSVNVKLHRMRGETSRIVGSVVQKYNFGPISRVLLELLPGFFMYPTTRRRRQHEPGLSSDLGDASGRMSASAAIHADRLNSQFDDVSRI